MGRNDGASGSRRVRALLAAGVSLAVAAGAVVAAAPASATTPTPTASPTAAPRPKGSALAVDVTGTAVLTLPAKDGLRDGTSVRIRSGAKGDVDLLAVRGKKVVHLADAVHLKRTRTGWQRTVAVHVRDLPTTGSWTVKARREDAPTVKAKAPAPLVVGSGKPVHVLVKPAAKVVYPYKDRALDRAAVSVTGTDETGAVLPLHGTVRLDAGKLHRTRDLAKGAVSIPVTGLPLGAGVLTTTVTGPAGKKAVRRTALSLAPTAVGTQALARSSDTLQPVRDGFLDALTLTTSGAASGGSPAKVSGTLTITSGRTVAATWAVPNGASHVFTWDGRIGGVIKPATYTATLTLHGPEGTPRVTKKLITVTKEHLPYTVQDLFPVGGGNQQGLAVHDGTFYVAFDNGDGTSRIQTYTSAGTPIATLGPIDIGHGAELAYSTTTGLLYAANGGATNPTKVWAIRTDWGAETMAAPATAIVDTVDLQDLGNNGMVAVDDAAQQLLVFSGTSPSYRVTPLTLTDRQDAAGNVVPKYSRGPSMPITIKGVPQGIEAVGSQVWVYTSLKGKNHLAKYDLPAGGTMSPNAAVDTDKDLMWSGEGEGSATGTWNNQPAFFVGAHDANRIGILVPVADE